MVATRYMWRPGSRYGDRDAQSIGEQLERLRRKSGGMMGAETVVEAAKPESSPLHPYFEWDDEIAGEEWRKTQARHLIAAVVVKASEPDREPVRAFVVVQQKQQQGYTSIEVAMSDKSLRRQVIERAKRELVSFRRRYAEYEELARVHAAIDQVTAPKLSKVA